MGSFPSRAVAGDVRFTSWLALAWSAVSPGGQSSGAGVVVRLMATPGRRQSWWGITLDDRWLRGGNGAVTIFDSLPAAEQFLLLLKVARFSIDDQCEYGHVVAGQAQEVYALGDGCNLCKPPRHTVPALAAA